MKKVLIIALTICLIFSSGCTTLKNSHDIPQQSSTTNNSKSEPQIVLDTNKSNVVNTANVENPFFIKNNISELSYKGKFLFDDIIEKVVKLHINTITELTNGVLYELELEPVEGVPNERLNLGYFYVQKDKIYKIEPTEENLNKLKATGEIPENSVVVSQDKEMKDILGKDELGLHQYIEVEGDKRISHSYNNKVESGYYETFTWEKDKGLTEYRSGYGAERDSIELQLINN